MSIQLNSKTGAIIPYVAPKTAQQFIDSSVTDYVCMVFNRSVSQGLTPWELRDI